jgi:hypothetical protein
MRRRIFFEECEHPGDLENYKQDLISAGASIVESQIEYDSESATVLIEVEGNDMTDFILAFQMTDSYEFATFKQP